MLMPEYQVAVSLEECVQITIKADTAKQAEHLAFDLVEREGGTDYPKEYSPSHSHRDYVVAVISFSGKKRRAN
tara:strand:- start:1900 stop:2118 length:219 start_codon:yes stop_codon:yes gene_type:complete